MDNEVHINFKIDKDKKKNDDQIKVLMDQKNYMEVWDQYCPKDGYKDPLPDILPPHNKDTNPGRIIVIGDIHGDFKVLRDSLKLAELIDKDDNWIGGNTIVVQVGDQIDRCRYKYKACNSVGATVDDEGNDWVILKYMTELHNKASKSKGAVYSLVGNHELMNIDGDFRYVSHEGINEFNKDEYKKDENFIADYKRKHPTKDPKDATGDDVRRWMFSPGNPISNFLACTRKVALIIGSNLFVHGGILPKIAKKYRIEINSENPDKKELPINKILTLYLLTKITHSKYKDILHSSDYKDILWTRDFSKATNKKKCDHLLNPLKEIYNVNNIYVGHTPMMTKGITSLCDGRIWLTDYGASSAFNPFDEINKSKPIISLHFDNRSPVREVQVLEIKNDTEIRIIKG